MEPDLISPQIGLPLAGILVLIFMIMVFYKPVKTEVNNFFANRRRKRRERNRAAQARELIRN